MPEIGTWVCESARRWRLGNTEWTIRYVTGGDTGWRPYKGELVQTVVSYNQPSAAMDYVARRLATAGDTERPSARPSWYAISINRHTGPVEAVDLLGKVLAPDVMAKVLTELHARTNGPSVLGGQAVIGMSPAQIAERLIGVVGQSHANRVAEQIYHAARGGTFNRPVRCTHWATGVYSADSIMPPGHYWYWQDDEHTMGYLAHV